MKVTLFLTICAWFTILNQLTANEIYFDTIKIVPLYLKDFFNITEVRITKYNRTTPVLNFCVDVLFDIDENLEGEINFHYNRLNNNQYNKMPFGIQKTKFDEIVEKFYTKYIMSDVINFSNLPKCDPPKTPCVFKRVRVNVYLLRIDLEP